MPKTATAPPTNGRLWHLLLARTHPDDLGAPLLHDQVDARVGERLGEVGLFAPQVPPNGPVVLDEEPEVRRRLVAGVQEAVLLRPRAEDAPGLAGLRVRHRRPPNEAGGAAWRVFTRGDAIPALY